MLGKTGVCVAKAWSNLSKTQWRAAIADANKMKNINKSGLSNKVWSGKRAERMLTVFSHLRRIWREPPRSKQASNKLSREDTKLLSFHSPCPRSGCAPIKKNFVS